MANDLIRISPIVKQKFGGIYLLQPTLFGGRNSSTTSNKPCRLNIEASLVDIRFGEKNNA